MLTARKFCVLFVLYVVHNHLFLTSGEICAPVNSTDTKQQRHQVCARFCFDCVSVASPVKTVTCVRPGAVFWEPVQALEQSRLQPSLTCEAGWNFLQHDHLFPPFRVSGSTLCAY